MSDFLNLTRRHLLGAAAVAPALSMPAFAQEIPYPTGDLTQGDPDAPVEMIEYVSLTCPHCAAFHVGLYQDLKRDYVDTGKVRVTLREVYFDKLGLWAAMVARCGGEAKYFGYIDLMLTRQQSWSRAEQPVAELIKIAKMGGATEEEVEACLTNRDFAQALVENYQTYYKNPHLTGTPSIVVGDEKVESLTKSELFSAIDAKLGS